MPRESGFPFAIPKTVIQYVSDTANPAAHTFENLDGVPFVVTHMDAFELEPGAGDTFTVWMGKGSSQFGVFGGGVGTGHVGPFWQPWDGTLVVPQSGGFIHIETSRTPGSTWNITVSGYSSTAVSASSWGES